MYIKRLSYLLASTTLFKQRLFNPFEYTVFCLYSKWSPRDIWQANSIVDMYINTESIFNNI